MVWISKKSRRGKRGVLPTHDGGTEPRQLRSCLKLKPGDTLFVKKRPSLHCHCEGSSNSERDRCSSEKSFLSVISGSSRSPDNASVEDQLRSNNSTGTAESAFSERHSSSSKSPFSSNNNSSFGMVARAPLERKKVRFGNVAIREHERAVGDNPSCSTGPPIGIGWKYADTKELMIDDFEETRTYLGRRVVLSRAEREEILLRWGVSFDDIIDSIRTNIRVKNQRRQTVTNLGKVERLEEALESAKKRIKRALLLRRSTGEKVKLLQEQAKVAAQKQIANRQVYEEHKVNEEESTSDPSEKTEIEIKDDRSRLPLPDLRPKIASNELARRASSLSDDGDLQTAISEISLGNTTSASGKELERFYRELELEMFGDMPLPNMVGETLEVRKGCITLEGEQSYHDSIANGTSASVKELERFHRELELEMFGDVQLPNMVGETLEVPELNIPERERVYYDPPCNEAYAEPPSVSPVEEQTEHCNGAMRDSLQSSPTSCIIFHDDPLAAIRMGHTLPPNVRLTHPAYFDKKLGTDKNQELQSSAMARAYLSETVTAMEQRYLHPSLAPPIPSYCSTGAKSDSMGLGPNQRNATDQINQEVPRRSSRRSRRRNRHDHPVVCHIPSYSKIPVNFWMDESNGNHGPVIRRSPAHEMVTITETPGCDDRIRPAIPPFMMGALPPPAFVPPPRYPIIL